MAKKSEKKGENKRDQKNTVTTKQQRIMGK